MEIQKTYYTCRLCLGKSEVYHSLFSENLINVIKSLTSIKIEEDNQLPSSCCKKCLNEVYMAYKVQQQIIETDRILRESLSDIMDYKEELSDGSDIMNTKSCQDIHNTESSLKLLEKNRDSKNLINEFKTQDKNKSSNTDETKSPLRDLEKNGEIKNQINDLNTLHNNKFSDMNKNTTNMEQVSTREKQQLECSLNCNKCNIKFENYKAFHNHILKHKFTKCHLCGASIRSDNFRRHYEMHTAPTEVCEICGKTAKNKESLRGHMFCQHKENPVLYKCDECNREFKQRYKYTLHIRKAHTGERNHQCEACGKRFFTLSDTRKHIQMTHLKARPYICSYCNKGFSSSYALRTHTRQHTLETPFRCDLCAAGFRQRVSLKTHMKSKHGIKAEKLQTNTANEIKDCS